MGHSLQGSVAVVTGAESVIGKEIALLFSAEGAKVICTYFEDKQAAERAQAEMTGECYFLKTDISKESQVESLFDRCLHYYGPPNVLVNSAGLNSSNHLVQDMPWRSGTC